MTLDNRPKPRILIVEDEPLIALDMQDELADAGFDVIDVAARLDQALTLIENRVYDAVILDTNLAGVNSSPAALALTARGLPYIVVTGYVSDQLLAPFGKVPLVTKPFDPPKLIAALYSILPAR